ncbi:protein of unassigned function [Methylobacterium oryzae CBMB20]|uniref:Protein of unassigned function n=1 Tax=Methylobacterium oryzae CBMB20 TaxID=693986 RepID=A0A089NUM0_9HYPH|nr:protein of unassigned function [Methylobacterium oryzae CBMB20]
MDPKRSGSCPVLLNAASGQRYARPFNGPADRGRRHPGPDETVM